MTTFKPGDRVRYTESGPMERLRGSVGIVKEVDAKSVFVDFGATGGWFSAFLSSLELVTRADYVAMLNESWRVVRDQPALEECARTLIAAFSVNPERGPDRGDVQQALDWALDAFGLPEDFPEQVHAQLQRDEQESA